MKALKGELQEREKGMPYLKEINFLKNFIENKSNNLSFEITVGSFNGKLYKIKYEADFNGSETFGDILVNYLVVIMMVVVVFGIIIGGSFVGVLRVIHNFFTLFLLLAKYQ